MKKDELDKLFEGLQGSFDREEPLSGHKKRFLNKLNATEQVIALNRKKSSWWKPFSVAASVTVFLAIGIYMFTNKPTWEAQIAEISPEVSKTGFYFASIVEEQIKELKSQNSPETQKIIDDTMLQLQRLENNYIKLEKDLLNGGNSKLILSAMITNFQTRIDLLQNVLSQIETIKNLKYYNDENITI